MSLIAKRFLIASLIYFVLGLTAQTVVVFDLWLGFNPLAYTTATIIQQFFLLGWLTQSAMALAYDRWLLDNSSASNQLVFILFNIGLPLTIIGQPGLAIFGGNWLGAVASCGAILQLLASLIFMREVLINIRKK